MLNDSQAKTLIERAQLAVKADKHQRFRRELDLRLSYYEGDQMRDLQRVIDDRYKRTSVEVNKFREVYNLTREVVDARAKAYWREPSRQIFIGDDAEDGNVQELWDRLVRDGEFNARGKMIDRYVVLWKSVIVWPRFRKLGERKWIKWEMFGPQSIWVVQDHDNPDELVASEAVVILLAARTETMEVEQSRFALYTQDEYSEFVGTIEGGFPQFEKFVPGREPQKHGLGRIPLTPFYDGIPMGELFMTKGNELILANRAVNVKRTDLAYLQALQSHGQLVLITDDDKKEVVIGPDVAIRIDPVEGADAKFISPSARLEESRAIVEWCLKMDASNEHLSPNRFSTEERTALSGVAKVLDEIDLVEDVTERQGLYLTREADLFDATRAVWNAGVGQGSGQTIPPEVEQRVGFVPLTFPIDTNAELEAFDKKVKLGAVPAWRAVQMEKPNLEDAKAQEEWADNMALLTKRSAASSPPGRRLFGNRSAAPSSPAAPSEPDEAADAEPANG